MQREACERYQNLSKEEKGKGDNTVMNDVKISEKMGSKSQSSVEKYYKMRKNYLL